MEKLKLNSKVIEKILLEFKNVFVKWKQLINISFSSNKNKSLYQSIKILFQAGTIEHFKLFVNFTQPC